jgi:hypothetical protein
MSGEIIEFRGHQELRQARRSGKVTHRRPARRARLEQQITRILNLVQDLEDMTRSIEDLRLPLLAQVPTLCARALAEADDKGSEVHPQPEVDHEILERIYGNLKHGVEAVTRC